MLEKSRTEYLIQCVSQNIQAIRPFPGPPKDTLDGIDHNLVDVMPVV